MNFQIHIHTHTHIHTYTYTCAYSCTYTYTHTYIHIYIYTYIHIYIYICVRVYVSVHVFICAYTYITCLCNYLCLPHSLSPSPSLSRSLSLSPSMLATEPASLPVSNFSNFNRVWCKQGSPKSRLTGRYSVGASPRKCPKPTQNLALWTVPQWFLTVREDSALNANQPHKPMSYFADVLSSLFDTGSRREAFPGNGLHRGF